MLTAPWRLGAFLLAEANLVAALGMLALAVAAFSRDVRAYLRELLRRDVVLSRRARFLLVAGAALFLIRVVSSSWNALEVNAWDLTINFDRPIEGVLHGSLLYSEEFGMSMLGNHATWLSFAFVPLYAIHATPWWLLVAHALAVAAGTAAAFAFFREVSRDDLVALLLAGAFLVNRYVAKATQYVFHPEIFYPAGLFLLFWSFLRQKKLPFALALVLLVSIKEDAIVPVFGFAMVAAIMYRRWRWGAAAMAAAAAVFAIDYFLVLPHFSRSTSGDAWYVTYWGSFGESPLEIAAGMLRQPLTVLQRVASGSSDIFLSLALMPLLGIEWLLAALPGLLIYGSADMDKLHWFTLYYSMPVLPAIFASIPFGIARVCRLLRIRDARAGERVCAMLVLLASVAIGAGHVFRAPHADRDRIQPLLAQAAHVPSTWIQGSIFPHVGYSRRLHVYNERARVDGHSAFLLSAELDPYFYDRAHFERLIAQLSADGRYRRIDSGVFTLFVPRNAAEGRVPRHAREDQTAGRT